MTVEQTSIIDAIGTDRNSGAIHLTVADHLEWNREHLAMLQEKLNAYLAFVESGEIYSAYPEAKGRNVVIDVILKHRPNEEAASFLEKIRSLIEQAGFAFHFGPISAGYAHDNG